MKESLWEQEKISVTSTVDLYEVPQTEVITIKQDNVFKKAVADSKLGCASNVFARIPGRFLRKFEAISSTHLVDTKGTKI